MTYPLQGLIFPELFMIRKLTSILIMLAVLVSAPAALALDPDFYAQSSRLASGRWAKVAVAETGMQFISNSTLRNLGFNDPSRVCVYGEGGRMLSENLTASMSDDLVPTAVVRTAQGIIFFGHSTVRWASASSRERQFSHTANTYSANSYYFVGEDADAAGVPLADAVVATGDPITIFTERLVHEQDLTSPGATGRLMLGEDFRTQTSRTFQFQLPGNTGEAVVTAAMGAYVTNGNATMAFTANGSPLSPNSTDRIAGITNSEAFIVNGSSTHNAGAVGEKLLLGLQLSCTGAVKQAALDFIEVEYPRTIDMGGRELYFSLAPGTASNVAVEGCSQSTVIWDVTDPLDIRRVEYRLDGSKALFTTPGWYREYVAFEPSKVSRAVTAAGNVANQDIHGMEAPDMVIIAPAEYARAAQRLADLHQRTDGLKAAVLTPEQVYNEFSSGVPDVTAFRKLLKMWHDRAKAGQGEATRYCLLMSRPSYDNRMVTQTGKKSAYPRIPIWQSPTGNTESSSFSTDDYIGMLDDNQTPLNMNTATLHVAVGRMPVKSLAEANAAVTKLEKYVTSPNLGAWRNNIVVIADDQDNGEHLSQAEAVVTIMKKGHKGEDRVYDKVYLDAYPLVMSGTGATYPGATKRLLDKLEEGTVWLNYIGHASTREWGHEGLLTWSAIQELQNRNPAFIYAATCSFMQWDGDDLSGAESLWLKPDAGVIGMICPSRKVYIALNGNLNRGTAQHLFTPDANGLAPRVGDIMRNGKNSTPSDGNKLRYGLMGDPAMRLAFPSMHVAIDDIMGTAGDEGVLPVWGARASAKVSGTVTNPDGSPADDFDGYVQLQLYDAEKPVTTHGNGEDGKVDVYNDRKTRLFVGRAPVKGGRWEAEVLVPNEIENNYSPALLAVYACSDDGREAAGHTQNLIVYGYDDSAPADTEGPGITDFYLNSPAFADGSAVAPSSVLYASLEDESGINVSEAGIGHRMALTLDSKVYLDDVSLFYQPDPESVKRGSIAYPLPSLAAGAHTVDLIVWDNAGNSTTRSLDFTVKAGWLPEFTSLAVDQSPAKSPVNFMASVDGIPAGGSLRIEVFNLAGRRLWTSPSTSLTGGGTDLTVPWDLTDTAGRRVERGIYIYRATITTAEGAEISKSSKLAVSAQ